MERSPRFIWIVSHKSSAKKEYTRQRAFADRDDAEWYATGVLHLPDTAGIRIERISWPKEASKKHIAYRLRKEAGVS